MPVINAEQIELHNGDTVVFQLARHENLMLEDEPNRFIQFNVPLVVHSPGLALRVVVLDPPKPGFVPYTGAYTLTVILTVVAIMPSLLVMTHPPLAEPALAPYGAAGSACRADTGR